MKYEIDDVRIREIKELVPPAHVLREFPATDGAATTAYEGRQAIHRVIHGADDRLVVVIGPCSIHDTAAALDYARLLRAEQQRLAVDSGVWPLYRFDPRRLDAGESPLKLDSSPGKTSVQKYMAGEGRFRMVELADPQRYRELVKAAERDVSMRRAMYEHLQSLRVGAFDGSHDGAASSPGPSIPSGSKP